MERPPAHRGPPVDFRSIEEPGTGGSTISKPSFYPQAKTTIVELFQCPHRCVRNVSWKCLEHGIQTFEKFIFEQAYISFVPELSVLASPMHIYTRNPFL